MNWNYISGFFDADGSISLTAFKKDGNKTLQISFHNNERNILEEIKKFIEEQIGVKGSISCKKARKETHQDSYDLKYFYRNAFKVSQMINSYHLKKKYRIKVYEDIQKLTKRNGVYTKEELQEKEKLTQLFYKH